MTQRQHLFNWAAMLLVGAMFWLLMGIAVTHAAWPENYIASTWTGAWTAPRSNTTVTCRSKGPQAVWVAEAGTQMLDIIQVGSVGGQFFYAYGRGVPTGAGSLYVEKHLGRSGTGWHTYGVTHAGASWTLTINGRSVAVVSDTFRTWAFHQTQVMAEGDLATMGTAACRLPTAMWTFGGNGPQPPFDFGATWWTIT